MIINADILDWCKTYDGPKFHALFADMPYHMTEMTKRFGKKGSAPPKYGTNGAFQRAARGFMGMGWDGGDLAFRAETWAAMAEYLYDGAWVMAFAASRGWHKMAIAIEGLAGIPINQIATMADLLAAARETRDWGIVEQVEHWLRSYCQMEDAARSAGLVIHPTVFNWTTRIEVPPMLGWVYGSGFRKATRVDTQVDNLAFNRWLKDHPEEHTKLLQMGREARALTEGSARREARKGVDVYRKELKERAGLAPRVVGKQKHAPKFAAQDFGYREKDNGFNSREREEFDLLAPATELGEEWGGHFYGLQALAPALEPIIIAQKPFRGSPAENMARTGAGALWIDGCRIPRNKTWNRNNSEGQNGAFNASGGYVESSPLGGWPKHLILTHHPDCNGSCVQGCPVRKMGELSGPLSSGERQPGSGSHPTHIGPVGLTGKPNQNYFPAHEGDASDYFAHMDWSFEVAAQLAAADLIRYCPKPNDGERDGGLDNFPPVTVDDGREIPIDNAYQRGKTTRRNPHPTLKPIKLTRYLAKLLLPPARYAPRRLMVPCSGVASEIIGALQAGWDEVVGIEKTAAYIPYAEARIRFFTGFDTPSVDDVQKAAETNDDGPEQLDLFGEAS